MTNIVICCDGTNFQFSRVNTNVVHLLQALERDTPEQKFFYDPGVGTFAARFFGFNVGNLLGRLLGLAFGYGIKRNLEDAYRYLMNEYEEGDRVFIFGFSRGAFTARSLASMVYECGVLHPHHDNLIPYVSKKYLGGASVAELNAFRDTFARPCRPHFVGVWETIGALGVLLSLRRFHNNRLSPGVANAYHAIAIDEKRRSYTPMLWDEDALLPEQNAEQVWFAGVHKDVGGGYAERELADITLRWMLGKARQHGLNINADAMARIKGDPLGTLHDTYDDWWRLLGTHVRQIPGTASVHGSVWARWEDNASYRPENLSKR